MSSQITHYGFVSLVSGCDLPEASVTLCVAFALRLRLFSTAALTLRWLQLHWRDFLAVTQRQWPWPWESETELGSRVWRSLSFTMPVYWQDADNDDEEDAVILYWWLRYRMGRRIRRRLWMNDIFRQRTRFGEYHRLVRDELLLDEEHFFNYFRMTREDFAYLLRMVEPVITKQNTAFRERISPRERLAVTIR